VLQFDTTPESWNGGITGCVDLEGFKNTGQLQVRLLPSPAHILRASFCSRLVVEDGGKFVNDKAVGRLDILYSQQSVEWLVCLSGDRIYAMTADLDLLGST